MPRRTALTSRLRALLLRQEGPTATEYAVLLGLVILVVLAAVTQIGGQITGIFNAMAGLFGL
jgi:pilus assembly protein Flp/PilA